MVTYSEWTAAMDSTAVTVDGHDLEVAYYEAGAGNGDPVVFMHGIPTNSYLFRQCELVGLEANHWVPEDRPEEFRDHTVEFLA